MSVNSSSNAYALQAHQHKQHASALKERTQMAFDKAQDHASNVDKLQSRIDAAVESGDTEKLETIAAKLEEKTAKITEHFDTMTARITERFDAAQTKALDMGMEGKAERLGQLSESVNARLTSASESTLGRLNEAADKIKNLLAESYADVGNSESDSETADQTAIDETA